MRLPRYFVAGVAQHLIQRGNNRQAIFADAADYRAYRDWLKESASRHGLGIHAYVLMTNHVHLLVTPKAPDSISRTLQSLGRRYVQYFNWTYERTGTLWEGRYRATVVDAERYFLACSRYIELNPVRAAMVSSLKRYPWSSYHHNALGEPDELLLEHDVYRRLGAEEAARREAYRDLFREALDPAQVEQIREATNKGWALGNDRFRAEIAGLAQRRAGPLPRGRPKKAETAEK